MRVLHGALALLVAAVLLAGCGGSGQADTVEDKRPQGSREARIALNGYMGPENVGILMAADKGYFDDVGVEATITGPATPEGPVKYVWEEIVDFGVTHLPQVVMARGEGAPIVALGSVVPRPTMAMIWLKKSGIDGIADLKGKTVAIPGGLPFQEAFLEVLLRRAGLTLDDVDLKRVVYRLVPTLVSGRADAIFGGSWNVEGAALAARGQKPVITRVQSLGIPTYDELVLIARTDRVSKEPQLVRDVLSAVNRGTAAAVEHPGALLKLIEQSGETDPNSTSKATEAELAATLPLLSEVGYMDPEQARELVGWMHEEGLIRRRLPISDLLTNDYLGLHDLGPAG
jgi:putative hydroxymethylpyrimidine transport system substrate-binding protein